MTERKVKIGSAASTTDTAADIAVSVDKATRKAVQTELEAPESPDEVAAADALDAAAMVAEGGPVDEPVNGREPAPTVAHEDVAPEIDAMEAEGGPVERPEAEEAEEPPAVEAAAAEGKVEEDIVYGPVADPPQPGPGNPSPDGATLAFLQSDDTGETRLWLYALDASGGWSMGLPFIPLVDDEGPQWSPDGKWLALTGSRYSGGPTSIWLAPSDGGECLLLADHEASDRQPRWSPDGSLVAFVSRRDGRDSICVALPDGLGPVIQLTYGYPGQDDRDPCWSEDSARIAFIRRAVDGETSGDHIWSVSLATGELKQATKKIANRHSLRWSPGKMQVASITDEGEWANVGVVNPDNSAGWNLASEAGDKGDPQYSPDGSRMMYTRSLKGEVRLCERATSGASADPLDPGLGVASSPRWLPEKRVVYRFAPATGSPHFIVQDAKKDVERTVLPSALPWQAGRPLVAPTHIEFETAAGLKLGGLLYRDPIWKGKTPGVVVLGDKPFERNNATFKPVEQALAAAGFAVFTPTMPGSPGLGKKIANALRDSGAAESDIIDLLDAVKALRDLDGVDERNVALVGEGYGGSLAMLLAGVRPGSVEAVVAIDPVTDWDDEFDQGSTEWRAWHARNFGLPAAGRGRHSLRTPATFAGVIESPLLLIGTAHASKGRAAQLEQLVSTIRELDVAFDHQLAGQESAWATAERAAAFIRGHLGENLPPEEPPTEEEAAPAEETERAEDV
jgi:dipeptidyl aminopeptidase/acylaminoacyl peptidase